MKEPSWYLLFGNPPWVSLSPLSVFVSFDHTFLSVSFSSPIPRSGELRTKKLKSHLVRTQRLNVLPLKPGIGQYIAERATLTARDFFLSYFYPSGPFTYIFSKISPDFSLCWLWLTHGSCVGPQNKIGHPAGCRFPCWVPAEYKGAKKQQPMTVWYDDLWND